MSTMTVVFHFPLFEVRIEVSLLNIKYCVTTCEPTLLFIMRYFYLVWLIIIFLKFLLFNQSRIFLIHASVSHMYKLILAK